MQSGLTVPQREDGSQRRSYFSRVDIFELMPGNSPASRPDAPNSPTGRSIAASTNTRITVVGGVSTRSMGLQSRPKPTPKWIIISRAVVESLIFSVVTYALTAYALVGDDMRLLWTEQPADSAFNAMTLICVVFFGVEIILCTISKEDYFMSFFFLLDLTSTITLIFDLSWVSEAIQGDEEDPTSVRGTQAAKVGARAARMVRVLRLVRILKLYKAVYEARQAKKRRLERMADPGAEEEDWAEVEADVKMGQLQRESRVGKKLSELTTRRVIVLILVMMIVLPLLRIDSSSQFPTSAAYGADVVREAFLRMRQNATMRPRYERALLQYIYYHSPFTFAGLPAGECPYGRTCSLQYDSHLFWFGVVSKSNQTVLDVARDGQLSQGSVLGWEMMVAQVLTNETTAWNYNFGPMPGPVRTSLYYPWDAVCTASDKKLLRLGLSLLREPVEGTHPRAITCPEDLRRVERLKYLPRVNVSQDEFENDWHFAFYFDLRPFSESESLYSLAITAFVCFALLSASVFFTSDANRLVLYPVENMISKVETIRANPLMAMKVADEEFKVEQMMEAKARTKQQSKLQSLYNKLSCASKDSNNEIMETVILEKTIIKLGSLLALGFGEAGASIIEHNMHGIDSACVDAMVEGTRVECIIGCTRIRDFSIATEVLQAKVMTFVNQIAEIVHGVADEFHGAANKNNGDMFLMIWKTSSLEPQKMSKIADMSVLAFTKIVGAVHRSPVLATYRGHPGLQQRLGKHCRVNVSSGLHYGWAIQGAVGSEFKIDASYLSPNVSIAESVERATLIYGVNILVAESVHKICTRPMANKCRLVDRVIITGSVTPMDLYVMDLDSTNLTVEPPPSMQINWTNKQRFKVRQFLEQEKAMKWHDDVQMVTYFQDNPDIATMRFRYTMEFLHVFNMGYQNYSQGEWLVAQRLLSKTKTMLGVEDGPSVALLRFMETPYQFEAPENWQGVHELGQTGF